MSIGKRLQTLVLALAVVTIAMPQRAAAQDETVSQVLISNVNVWDGTSGTVMNGVLDLFDGAPLAADWHQDTAASIM